MACRLTIPTEVSNIADTFLSTLLGCDDVMIGDTTEDLATMVITFEDTDFSFILEVCNYTQDSLGCSYPYYRLLTSENFLIACGSFSTPEKAATIFYQNHIRYTVERLPKANTPRYKDFSIVL